MNNNKAIKSLVLIGLLAASLTAGKLVLMQIPNVEIVTLLIIMTSAVFGYKISLPSTIIFVSIEMLLFGINTWVISYYIHWCALAIVTAIVSKLSNNNRIALTIVAAVMTVAFGLLTTLVDTIFASSISEIAFIEYYSLLYVRGIAFFAIHTIFNTVIVFSFYPQLTKILTKLKKQYFVPEGKNI